MTSTALPHWYRCQAISSQPPAVMRAGSMASDRIGVRDVGETKMPARGYLRALYVDGQGMSQGGQVCQSENWYGFNAFTTGWPPMPGFWSKWPLWSPLCGFLTKILKSTLRAHGTRLL